MLFVISNTSIVLQSLRGKFLQFTFLLQWKQKFFCGSHDLISKGRRNVNCVSRENYTIPSENNALLVSYDNLSPHLLKQIQSCNILNTI